MKTADQPINPAPTMQYSDDLKGLTKREYFALEFAKVFIQKDWERPITNGIEYADILIARLEKEK